MAFSKLASFVGKLILSAAFVIAITLSLPKAATGLPVTHDVMDPRTAQTHVLVEKTDCAVPSNLHDMFQAINSKVDRTNFLQNTLNGQATTATFTTRPSSHTQDVELLDIDAIDDLNEAEGCPANLTRDPEAPLEHRSLCPYFFRVKRFPGGFYPSTIRNAACKCQRCVENTGLACKVVTTNINVLKPAGCFQGMQKYEEMRVSVNTACVCAYNAAPSVGYEQTPSPMQSGFVQ